MIREELHSDALLNSQIEQMFQIDIGSGVAKPFGLRDSKAGSLADDVVTSPRLINRSHSVLISVPTLPKNIDFV